ncbi:MAG: PDZ domain-containing protein [Candidatus Brocadiia bacterium]
MKARAFLAIVLLAFVFVPVFAEDVTPALAPEVIDAIGKFAAGTDMENNAKAIVMSNVKPTMLYRMLRAQRTYAAKPEKLIFTDKVEINKKLTLEFACQLPDSYDPAVAYPVVINLHGGVSRPKPIPIEMLSKSLFGMLPLGDNAKYIEIIPQGCAECTWWSAAGVTMITKSLRQVAAKYHVDTNRVFLAGFSDGGSGSWYGGLFFPTAFAGVVPLNGTPLVAGISGGKVYLTNLRNRSIFACNTADDPLYPKLIVQPVIDKILELQAPLTFKMFDDGGHTFAYSGKVAEDMAKWWTETTRNPWREKVEWAAAATMPNRCDWLTIAEVGETESSSPYEPAIVSVPSPMRLGITMDTAYEGEGIKVAAVEPESNAAKLGLKEGDIITELNGQKLTQPGIIMQILASLKDGDEVTVKFTRDGKEETATSKVTKPAPREMFKYNGKPGWCSATKVGNNFELKTNNVKKILISLSPEFVDFTRPVVVMANGVTVFDGPVEPVVQSIIESYMADFDPQIIATAVLEVEIK